jgi:hypothetical protein
MRLGGPLNHSGCNGEERNLPLGIKFFQIFVNNLNVNDPSEVN